MYSVHSTEYMDVLRMFCSGAACGFEQGNVSCVVGCGNFSNKW